MSRKTRHRQLAKQAARRQAEKRQRQRRRRTAGVAAAFVVGIAGTLIVMAAIRGGEEPPAPPRESPSPSPGATTGTVEPEPGPETVACGGEVPPAAAQPKPQFNAPPMVIDDDTSYTATLRTSCGDIVIELLSSRARQAVNSFVFLAREGFFDGTRIHRIDASIDVIQGGDPTGTGSGGPGYQLVDELDGTETYGPGVVAMANSGPDTAGSQFFVVTGPDGHLLDDNPVYTIFGRVTEGMDVVRRIARIPVLDPGSGLPGQQPARAVYVESVTIAEA